MVFALRLLAVLPAALAFSVINPLSHSSLGPIGDKLFPVCLIFARLHT